MRTYDHDNHSTHRYELRSRRNIHHGPGSEQPEEEEDELMQYSQRSPRPIRNYHANPHLRPDLESEEEEEEEEEEEGETEYTPESASLRMSWGSQIPREFNFIPESGIPQMSLASQIPREFNFIPESGIPRMSRASQTPRSAQCGSQENLAKQFPSLTDTGMTDCGVSHHVKKNASLLAGLVGMAVIVVVSIFAFNHQDLTTKSLAKMTKHQEDKLREGIKNIMQEFQSQENNLWPKFVAEIKKTVEEQPNTPSVFLLLHQGDGTTSACLAQKVGAAASEFLNDAEEEPVVVEGYELGENDTLIKDYGVFTDDYKSIMESKRVMIVHNLQEMPASIAQTFHNLCDPDNPLVDKAVYMFTMETSSTGESPTKVAEVTLSNLWKNSLDLDIMQPLITRITNEVLIVRSERKPPCMM